MGYERVRGVNFSHKPLNGDKYRNKRAEMWAEMKEWFQDQAGVQIPDDDGLHSQICAPSYKYDASNRLVLESKEDIKKRVKFSPDGGDAIAAPIAVRSITGEEKADRSVPEVDL